MTSKEIAEIQPTDISERSWMREIALQLALLNEKKPLEPKPIIPQPKPNFQPKQHR